MDQITPEQYRKLHSWMALLSVPLTIGWLYTWFAHSPQKWQSAFLYSAIVMSVALIWLERRGWNKTKK